jgi:predicted nucleotidyltransferase
MNSVCGIIAEYNPFHNGHGYHLAQSLRETGGEHIIAVMSGNFVQRGEPAIIDKYSRVKMALCRGADIVLELPVTWATASAEGFASGACRLLAAANIVDSICFGSEIGEIGPLYHIARHLCHETDEFKSLLKEQLARGVSFAAARATALAVTLNEAAAETINQPNNILGIEYLKAIIKNNLALVPHTIKRRGAEHNSDKIPEATTTVTTTASAGAIRKHIVQGGDLARLLPLMSRDCYDILAEEHGKGAINTLDNFSPYFHHALHVTSKERLSRLSGLSTGLQNRLVAAAGQRYLISDVLAATKSKNHAHTALQRAVLRILLGIEAEAVTRDISYIRVLGFRQKKEALLRRLYAAAAVPVITNLKHTKNLPINARAMLDLEITAARAFWLGLKSRGVPERNELAEQLVIV